MKQSLLSSITGLCIALLWGAPAAHSAEVSVGIPSTETEFQSTYTIIDADGDNASWIYTPEDRYTYANVAYPGSADTDGDILVLPGLDVKAGQSYNLKFQFKSSQSSSTQKFDILTGYGTEEMSVLQSGSVSASYNTWYPSSYSPIKYTATQDGTLHLGIRSTKGSQTGAKLIFLQYTYEALIDVPAKCTDIKAVSADGGKLEATITWTWPSKTKYGTDIIKLQGARIYRSTTTISKFTDDYLVGTVGEGIPGETGTFVDTTVPEAGNYYYYVRAINAEGEADEGTYAKTWVGEDTKVLNPLAVSSTPVATAAGDNVELTFTPRKEAYNTGAWVDKSKITFRIKRRVGVDPATEVVITEDFDGETMPYVDNTLPGANAYTYYIEALYKGTASSALTSNTLFAGGALSIPYSDDFSDNAKFNTYTQAGGAKWERNSTYKYASFGAYYNYAYMLTPPFELEAGRTYRLSAQTWVDDTSKTYDLTITAGKTTNDQTILSTITVDQTSSSKITAEGFFTPEESGRYCFGLKTSEASSSYYKLHVDDLLIEESVTKPAPVTDLTITPGAEGALSATVSFTAPSLTNGGVALESISRIEVSRSANGQTDPILVKTIGDATPGAPIEFSDEVPEENTYTYHVTSFLGENPSNEAKALSPWIGYDQPSKLSDFSLSYNLNDDGTVSIKWSAASSPVLHNGYVDKDGMKYRVTRLPDNTEVALTTELSVIDTEAPTIAYGRYKYQVCAVNGHMSGDPATGYSKLTLGDAIALPYEPDFTDEAQFDLWDGRGWIHDSDDTHVLKYKYELSETPYTVYLPPFRGESVTNISYKLTFETSRLSADYEELLNIYLCKLDAEEASTPQAQARAAIAGEDNRTLIKQVSVTAMSADPAKEEVSTTLPAKGKYRMAIECVSPYNYGVKLHSLKLEEATNTGIDRLSATSLNGIAYDSSTATLLLPEDVRLAEVFTTAGTLVLSSKATSSVSLASLPAGIYIVRASLTDGTTATLKVTRK